MQTPLDQDFNAIKWEDMGVGIKLEIGEVTEEQLKDALSQVLYNETFKENTRKMSKLFMDLPAKPIDTAVWWVEYVLRHEDFSHLKPLARHQTWWQRRSLDVWFALLAVALFLVLSPIVLLIILKRYAFGGGPAVTRAKNGKVKSS